MDLGKAILFGILFTVIGFGISFLILHIGTSLVLDQSGVEFIKSVNVGRVAAYGYYHSVDSTSFVTKLLSDKGYSSIVAIIIIIVLSSNIFRQLNKKEGGS